MERQTVLSIIYRTVFVFLCVASEALIAKCTFDRYDAVFFVATLIISGLIFFGLFHKSVISSLYKALFAFSILLFFVVLLAYILNNFNILHYFTNVDTIRYYISASGTFGIVIFFVVTLLQVVVLPIPAAVTVVLGSILYGNVTSFIVSSLGTILGSFVCYLIGSKLGYKVIVWIAGKSTTEKVAKYLSQNGKIPFVLMLLFPFFPDDVLCMLAGLTKMPLKFFSISVCVCRSISTALICFLGTGNIIPFSGWGIPVWISLFAVLLFISRLISAIVTKKNDRHNT